MADFHAVYKCENCGEHVFMSQRDTIEMMCQCGNMIFNSAAWTGARNSAGGIKYDGTLRRKPSGVKI